MQISDDQLEYYRERCSILEEENLALKEVIKRKDRRISGLEKKLSSAGRRNASLEKRISELNARNKELTKENKHLKQELASLKVTVSAVVARSINAKPKKKQNRKHKKAGREEERA